VAQWRDISAPLCLYYHQEGNSIMNRNLRKPIVTIKKAMQAGDNQGDLKYVIAESLKNLLEGQQWLHGSDVRIFEEFCQEHLGCRAKDLLQICRHDTYVVSLINEALKINHQGIRRVKAKEFIDRPSGTSREQALRRLKKDRPELYDKVVKGQLSAHEAMVKAGFRKPYKSVRPEVNHVAAFLHEHFDDGQLREIIQKVFALRQGYVSIKELREGKEIDLFGEKVDKSSMESEIRIMAEEAVTKELGPFLQMVLQLYQKHEKPYKNRGNHDNRQRFYYRLL
jgi:hypothetical protein